MLKNIRLPSLIASHNPLTISSQTGIIFTYLEMKLVPRNWPAKTIYINSEVENEH